MKNTTPLWLSHALPAVIFSGGVYSIVTKSFWMAGGAKGATSEITGATAVWAGVGMVFLSLAAFIFFRYLGRKD